MSDMLRVSDGGKAASFDGFILEVSGLSGSSRSRRLAIEVIESVGILPAGDELMFGVKSRKGGFAIVITAAHRAEWQAIVTAVEAARARLPRE